MKKRTDLSIPEEEIARQNGFLRLLKEYADQREAGGKGRPRALIHTYGCQMNVHDSEKLRGMLDEAGFATAQSEEDADLVLFNTCCVRDHAETRVYGNVGHLGKVKQERPDLIIGVCGCMMQQQETAKALYARFPFVDMVFGTHALHAFPEILYHAVVEKTRTMDIRDSDGTVPEHLPVRREPGRSAFVTIMYGCNNFCTYCIVPYVRGRERSRLPQNIIREVKELVSEGYVEVTVLGQNVNSYGKDAGFDMDFPGLLRALNEIEGLARIRFMTSHPKDLSDDLIRALAECDKLCKHVHLPVQSGSNEILRRMNRRYTREYYFTLLKKLRAAVPGIEISTDIIVGFPGETEQDFEDTLDLVRKADFCAAFTFMYSKRKGTPAERMEDQVDDETKRDRLLRLNALQAQKTAENNRKYIDTIQTVLVEGCDNRDGCNAFGKNMSFKSIYFPGDPSMIGTFQKVKVTSMKNSSLIGQIIQEDTHGN